MWTLCDTLLDDHTGATAFEYGLIAAAACPKYSAGTVLKFWSAVNDTLGHFMSPNSVI
jgi:hypothetical protein